MSRGCTKLTLVHPGGRKPFTGAIAPTRAAPLYPHLRQNGYHCLAWGTEAQRTALKALGAVEQSAAGEPPFS
jgi:hypothetical protein